MLRNRWKCNRCGDVVESRFGHDFQTCSCFGKTECCGVGTTSDEDYPFRYYCGGCSKEYPRTTGVAVDGGTECARVLGYPEDMTDMCE